MKLPWENRVQYRARVRKELKQLKAEKAKMKKIHKMVENQIEPIKQTQKLIDIESNKI